MGRPESGAMISERFAWLWRARRIQPLPVLIAAVAVALAALGRDGLAALAWQRAAIESGEAWRLVSGQLVHLGIGHLLLNLAALAAAMALFTGFRTRDWAGSFACSGLAVAAGLWWASPGLAWYAGLSGALHGVYVAGAVAWLWQGERGGWLLAAGLVAKLAWEAWAGPSALSETLTGGAVVTAAHLYGALGGLVWGLAGRPGGAGYNDGPAARDSSPGHDNAS